jgi:hypothetical protein
MCYDIVELIQILRNYLNYISCDNELILQLMA